MSSGERPIGAAKGKQSDTEALCSTPPLWGKDKGWGRTRGGGTDELFFSVEQQTNSAFQPKKQS